MPFSTQPSQNLVALRSRLLMSLAMTVLCLAALPTLSGCAALGVAANATAGPMKKVHVTADYTGLADKTVAIVIAADEFVLYRHPRAPLVVGQIVGGQIVANVTGAKLTDPADIVAFQRANPYWATLPYGDLAKRLGVERVIYIDLAEYSTHEPGNKELWQGVILANLGVIETDAANPDNFAYSNTIRAVYPEGREIGVANSDAGTIQLGMLQSFGQKVGWLFYDHDEYIPR